MPSYVFLFSNYRLRNAFRDSVEVMSPPSCHNCPIHTSNQAGLRWLKRTVETQKEDDVIDNVFRLRKRSGTESVSYDELGNVFRLKKRNLNYN